MKFVMPGDRIGYSEEFVCGEGVYEESGEIFAAVAGFLEIKDRTVNVKTINRIPEIKKGDVVIGRVFDVRNSLALIEIARKKGENRPLTKSEVGSLHISNIQESYLDNISKALKYLDIVKARVIDEKLMRLSTKEVEMGVVKSICSICKHEMVREGDILKCPECGNVERRKLSRDYGKGEW
jgi:exosome complex component CSL4